MLNIQLLSTAIVVTQNAIGYQVGAGQLARNSAFILDHPTLFIQIDESILCSAKHSTSTKPRRLHIRDYAAVEAYLEELHYQFAHNYNSDRVIELMQVPQELWQPYHTRKYNNLYNHVTALILASEKKCVKKNQIMSGALNWRKQVLNYHIFYY
jgi:hypothetical protein